MIIQEIKLRLTTLNIIRLVIGVAFIGEALHSSSWIFGVIGAVLLAQIFTNKKCATGACDIEQ